LRFRPQEATALTVDIAKLRPLIELLQEGGVLEFEHESDGEKIRIVRGYPQPTQAAPVYATAYAPAPPPGAPGAALPAGAGGGAAATPSVAPESSADSEDVTSPFVGTFYRAPSPDIPSFVEVGTVVRPGQTMCIVEAMKLMNEIESEVSGIVTEVYAQNGKPVEFGQKLFRIKKT
jgi:acetyl-CoA carboxylase biotin carboxyl carrier protein